MDIKKLFNTPRNSEVTALMLYARGINIGDDYKMLHVYKRLQLMSEKGVFSREGQTITPAQYIAAQTDSDGNNPLHYAMVGFYAAAADVKIRKTVIANFLTCLKVDWLHQNNFNESPLDFISQKMADKFSIAIPLPRKTLQLPRPPSGSNPQP